jgi:Cobalamin-independent synthase, Catalytic domain
VLAPIVEAVRAATDRPFKLHMGIVPVTLAAITADKHYGGDIKALSSTSRRPSTPSCATCRNAGASTWCRSPPLTFFENDAWIIEALNTAFEGISLRRVVHICYGHEEGQQGQEELRASRFLPWAFNIDCDAFHLEMAGNGFAEVEALRGWPKNKDLIIGALDGKNLRVERPAAIADSLRRVLEYVPAEQVGLPSDCALASLRQIVAVKKMQALAEGARIVREELTVPDVPGPLAPVLRCSRRRPGASASTAMPVRPRHYLGCAGTHSTVRTAPRRYPAAPTAMNIATPEGSPAKAMSDPLIATPAADPVCRAVLRAADAVPA